MLQQYASALNGSRVDTAHNIEQQSGKKFLFQCSVLTDLYAIDAYMRHATFSL